jgi:steroid delta-isomerase-like uncharacterized protein
MSTSNTAPQGAAGATGKNKEILRRIYQVFENGNYSELDNLISNDIVEHSPDPLVQGTGLPYVKSLFKTYREAIPDLKFRINDIIEEGDKLVAYITLTGTNKGPIMGKPATNKKIEVDGIDICRVSNEKVTDHWGIWDNFTMMKQLGFIPGDI